MTETRVPAGRRKDLAPQTVRTVALPPDDLKRPREALVLLGTDGQPRAYLNRCRHLPVPLDGGSRDFLTPSGDLLCGTHGAIYRVDDGVCTAGPCRKAALFALPLEEEAGELFVLLGPWLP